MCKRSWLVGFAVIVLFAFLSLYSLGDSAPEKLLFLRVQNGPQQLFQQVVEYPLNLTAEKSDLTRSKVQVVETEPNGKPKQSVPAQYDGPAGTKKGILSFLLPGVTEPGASRHFSVSWRIKPEKDKIYTDLQVEKTPKTLEVSNTYFKVIHPLKGNGGFPASVQFHVSGNTEKFIFEDRLYEKSAGYFTLRGDSKSTTKLVSAGPLRVVVETRARYFSDHYAPGNARATYRYIYYAYSPIISVTAKVERDDDFAWSELHFLQISRKDNLFSRWAGGSEPAQRGQFTDQRKGYALPGWAVMYNEEDAIGLGFEGTVSLFDGIGEYYNYIQQTIGPWKSRTQLFSARVYLGPARKKLEEFAQFLTKELEVKIEEWKPVRALKPKSIRESVKYTLRNEKIILQFASEEDGLGLTRLANVITRTEFIIPSSEKPFLWRLVFRSKEDKSITIDNATPAPCSAKMKTSPGGQTLELLWEGLSIAGEPSKVNVRVEIMLPRHSGTSLWRIYVDNRSDHYGLWELHFPLIANLSTSGLPDIAVPRSNWGYLYRKAKGEISGSYPSANWPMQFLCVNQGNSGLYLAAHDPGARPKGFSYTPGKSFHFYTFAENMGVPGSDFKGDFSFALGVYQGNWITGCKMYRRWALHQPWARRGPLISRKDTPAFFKNLGLWMLGGGTKEEVVPQMIKAQKFFKMPLGIHWYNWHQIGFDTQYPEYFPYKPGFPEGVKELTRRGLIAMPYINGRLWDSAIESFKSEGHKWCTKQVTGEPYIEVYNPQIRHAVMCPATQFWQDKVNEIVGRLIKECGVNAIYIDQIGAAGPQLCFDPTHRHPLGGGTHWVDGYRKLLERVKKQTAGLVAITTENNAEPYMDGVDAFLIWNPRYPEEIPMMTAVYSGYTIYFSSPAYTLGEGDTAFVMVEGRDFLWGCQQGWMGFELLNKEHEAKAKFLRELGRYRLAAKKYLVYGELLGELEPAELVPEVKATWRGWGGGAIPAALPAVMSSVWRGSDGSLGLFFVNFDSMPHTFTYQFDPKAWGDFKQGKKATPWLIMTRLTPLGSVPIGIYENSAFSRTEYLRPREIMVLKVAGSKSRQAVLREVLWRLSRDLQMQKQEPLITAARQCISKAMADISGLSWKIKPKAVKVASGDHFFLTLETQNCGKKLQRLNLYWFPVAGIAVAKPVRTFVQPGKRQKTTIAFRASANERWVGHCIILKGRIEFGPASSGYWVDMRIPVTILPPLTTALQIEGETHAGETHLFRVKVSNNSKQILSPRLFLKVPENWSVEPGSSLRLEKICPGEEREIIFKCDLPPEAEVGSFRLRVFLVQESISQPIEVAPARPAAQSRLFDTPPQIDGNLSEWLKETPVVVDNGAHIKIAGWKGVQDLSARAWTGWDELYFYFAAEVVDDVFHQPYRHRDIWRADCIQLALRPGKPKDNAGYDDDTHEFGLALTPQGPEIFKWLPEEYTVTRGKLQVKRTETGLNYEVAIPWGELGGFQPVRGSQLTWSFTVNEADNGEFRGWLEWTPGICGGKDASQFGFLKLQ